MIRIGAGVGVSHKRRSAPAPFNLTDLGPELISWLDATDADTLTLSGSTVTEWYDRGPVDKRFRSDVATNGSPSPPTISGSGTGRVIIFASATNQVLAETDPYSTYLGSQQLPDGLGGRGAGLSFSATGCAYDPVTGGLIIGNDGRATDPQNISTATPSLVFTDVTGATKLGELALSTGQSCQGVCVDPVDGHIWCARSGKGVVEKVTYATSGTATVLASYSVSGVSNPNALAIDPVTGYHYLTNSESTTGYIVDPSDGSIIDTITFLFAADHLCIDGHILYVSNTSYIHAYDLTTRNRIGNFQTAAQYNRGEGIVVRNGIAYVAHNGSYHATSTPTPASPDISTLFRYRLHGLITYPIAAAQVDFFWAGSNGYTASGTKTLLQFGDPLTTGGADRRATGVYVPNATQFALYLNTTPSGTQVTAAVTPSVSPSVRGVWHLSVNGAAGTFTVRHNGAIVAGPIAITVAGGLLYLNKRLVVAGAVEGINSNRELDCALSAVAVRAGDAVLSDAQRQKIEGALAWDHGIALPSGHPYETARP